MTRWTRCLLLALLLVVVATPAHAAPCKPVGANALVEFDFRETPLRDVTRWISCARNLNIMFQTADLSRLKVTWISSRKVKGRSLKRRFEAMLRQEGLRLRRNGGFLIIESAP